MFQKDSTHLLGPRQRRKQTFLSFYKVPHSVIGAEGFKDKLDKATALKMDPNLWQRVTSKQWQDEGVMTVRSLCTIFVTRQKVPLRAWEVEVYHRAIPKMTFPEHSL